MVSRNRADSATLRTTRRTAWVFFTPCRPSMAASRVRSPAEAEIRMVTRLASSSAWDWLPAT